MRTAPPSATDTRPRALLIHGAGGGGWEWAIWRAVFEAADWAVDAPDLGAAAAGLESTTLQDWRDQLQPAAARADALVGASVGGLLALLCGDPATPRVLVNPLPPSPWQHLLPARDWPDRVPWGQRASLAGTRRALPDADEATCIDAARRWRDAPGRVLREAAAGVAVAVPRGPVLVMASLRDTDVPPEAGIALAQAWGSDLVRLPGSSHVGALLGRRAAQAATQAVAWLNARDGLRTGSPAAS